MVVGVVVHASSNQSYLKSTHYPHPSPPAVLEAELGRPPSTVFAQLSASPVAAASLGQVRGWGWAEEWDIGC